MRVTRLELFDFRNYERLRFEPGPGLNILVGANAQGKSNLLEALYALATTKSLRASRDAEMVRFGAEACRILAHVARETGGGEVVLEMAVAAPAAASIAERKIVKVNGARHTKIADLIGNLNAVLFSSFDLLIVRGEPEERRRFLNYEIAQVSPRYVLALGMTLHARGGVAQVGQFDLECLGGGVGDVPDEFDLAFRAPVVRSFGPRLARQLVPVQVV